MSNKPKWRSLESDEIEMISKSFKENTPEEVRKIQGQLGRLILASTEIEALKESGV